MKTVTPTRKQYDAAKLMLTKGATNTQIIAAEATIEAYRYQDKMESKYLQEVNQFINHNLK